jgi:hypothetical protein
VTRPSKNAEINNPANPGYPYAEAKLSENPVKKSGYTLSENALAKVEA